MFDWFRYCYKLARLQLTYRKAVIPLEEEYQRAMKAARSDDERGEALSVFMHEVEYRYQQAALQSDYLYNQAGKRLIPLPEMTDADLFGRPERSSVVSHA